MNQLLIVLCLIAGTWYLVSANLKNDQDGIPLSEVSAPAPTSVEQYKTDSTSSEQLKLQPINPVAEQSGHAIVPDQSPAALVAGSESPSQPAQFPQPEIGPTPGDRLQVKSEASIRSGPSASAQVIGTAHAGAKLQVQSRDAEWVQFWMTWERSPLLRTYMGSTRSSRRRCSATQRFLRACGFCARWARKARSLRPQS